MKPYCMQNFKIAEFLATKAQFTQTHIWNDYKQAYRQLKYVNREDTHKIMLFCGRRTPPPASQIIEPPNFQKGVEGNPCLWAEVGISGVFYTSSYQ